MARVLGACRESGRGEESISIPNQESRIRLWASNNGHAVVHVTKDSATSGEIAARKREELGPWLTDPDKIAQWDILVGAKLDRMSRSVLDFAQLTEWLQKRGKQIVSVTEGYDFTTPEGELMANQMIAFAQFERKRAGQRRGEAAAIIRDAGRWNGGRVAFGYAPVGSKGNWRLEPDIGGTAEIALLMVADAIAGKGFSTIARELNARGIASPLGRAWKDNSVQRILTSPALIGYTVQMRGNVVTVRRDSQGRPIRFTDHPLITEDQYRKLQDAIKSRSRHRGEPQARHLLWHVAYCRNCSQGCEDELPCPIHDVPLYGHRRHNHLTKGNYYACKRCGMTVPLEKLDTEIEQERVLKVAGHVLLPEKATIPGDDYSTEIARLERRAERRRAELDEDPEDEDLARSVHKLEEKIAELMDPARTPRKPEREEWVPVVPNVTIAEHWATLDTEGRNKIMRDWGTVFYAWRDVDSHGNITAVHTVGQTARWLLRRGDTIAV